MAMTAARKKEAAGARPAASRSTGGREERRLAEMDYMPPDDGPLPLYQIGPAADRPSVGSATLRCCSTRADWASPCFCTRTCVPCANAPELVAANSTAASAILVLVI